MEAVKIQNERIFSRKKRQWLAEVKIWQIKHANHPENHFDHAEEKKYRRTLKKVDQKIRKLQQKK